MRFIVRHYGKRTIDGYLCWVRYYIRYHDKRHPLEMGAGKVMAFLSFLACERCVSVATQKIELNALARLRVGVPVRRIPLTIWGTRKPFLALEDGVRRQ